MVDILKSSALESAESCLEEIKTLLETSPSERDGKHLLRLSFEYYNHIPSISPVPSYIADKLELYNKFQSLRVSWIVLKFKYH